MIQVKALSVVYISSLSLSLIGSFSIVVVSIVKRRHLNEQAPLLSQLALADFMAAAVLLCTNAMNFIQSEQLADTCSRVLPLSLTFYCISFILVMIYACKSKQAVQGWRERPDNSEEGQVNNSESAQYIRLYFFVWFIPICAYVCYVLTLGLRETSPITGEGLSDNSTSSSCILFQQLDEGERVLERCFVFLCVLTVLISSSVVYYQVSSWYRRYEESCMFLRGLQSTTRSMVLVIIVCWTPAFVLIPLSMVPEISQHTAFFILQVLQALTVSLHGLLNSIVYGWLRPNFRRAVLGESMPLLGRFAKPFFEDSLSIPPRETSSLTTQQRATVHSTLQLSSSWTMLDHLPKEQRPLSYSRICDRNYGK
ncbi:hypothetical protein AAFF_G00172060 [Aldrovandia affinis]|uniref:G-protein coupled receptors family 1 profile domain-containing protein n=1 Tax=Aldrovandia affinis TaxID=143900 RepID=A0AAD7SYP3_9TELE|nr:hypothetical protein AAFF_G00172060 [Aldrovandia affinis]